MAWTQFYDMHSGGGQKEDWSKIYVELSEEQAKVWFYNRFGHSPDRVTCTCCGRDYWTDEVDEDEIEKEDSLVVPRNRVKDIELEGSVPLEGYVWM